MTTRMPAVSLAAVPGRRAATLELGQELERRGFAGIYGPSMADSLALRAALALKTERIALSTTITPIYSRTAGDLAHTAAGLTTPILVPASAHGNQMKAFEELFATFS
ncbi:MAG: hypothetical protein OXT09_33755 [Myxococcales bacterium]|nr:hypothetical protein [Myxococcales bacterium]